MKNYIHELLGTIITVSPALITAILAVWKLVLDSNKRNDNIINGINELKEEVNKIKEQNIETQSMTRVNRDGLKYTQRYRLQHDMHAFLKRGYVTSNELEELAVLHDSYKNLGGNGAISALFGKVEELPIKEME